MREANTRTHLYVTAAEISPPYKNICVGKPSSYRILQIAHLNLTKESDLRRLRAH